MNRSNGPRRPLFLVRTLGIVVGVLFGFPLGCLVTTAIFGAARCAPEHPRVMRFGDIVISAFRPRTESTEIAEELLLRRNGRSFLWAARNTNDQVTDVCLLNGPERIVLTMKASTGLGGWVDANYGRTESRTRLGEHYRDLDFDGQFDVMSAYDVTGKLCFSRIRVQGGWRQVDRIEGRKAFLGKEVFTFHGDTCWQPEVASAN